jgi:DNA-binding CsgD family transcriptional regulator
MAIRFYAFIFILFSLINQDLKPQSRIEGYMLIDTTIWKPIVYLSLIPDFDNLHTITNDMIIDQANIDSIGRFYFDIQYFPESDNLFRIHLTKKVDPPASLIIGGKDENHIFLIANNRSQITITDTSELELFKDVLIKGYYPNILIREIDEKINSFDTIKNNVSEIKKELIRNTTFQNLRLLADTCSSPLVSLYALYKSNYENNYQVNSQRYRNFLSKWEKDKSSYFLAFRKRIPSDSKLGVSVLVIISIVSLIVGFIICLIVIRLFKKSITSLHDLSIQERKIFALIKEGKSNKEISDDLNIGLSTVKSHVNSIYTKLDIKSRKEVLNLDLDNSPNKT